MDNIRWANKKNLYELKKKIRQETIQEIKECCECRKCKKFKNYLKKSGV
ncbi:hypothetical protein [Abyssisolibacter fermentans]|nr:hypothetical protein [Abyssisolibacter fermentans]